MLRDHNKPPILPQCADPALKAFYSALTEADVELLQRGVRILLNCQDTACAHYPCASATNQDSK